VNGNLCLDEGRRLKAGDVLHLFEQSQAKPPDLADVQIRFMDEHLVVIEKPAGVTTLRHAEERDWPEARKDKMPTLEELVQRLVNARTPRRPGVKPPKVRAVHRLDRDTSGLMLFALSPAAEQKLVSLFKHHEIDRIYWAIVYGHPTARRIESWFTRDRGDGLRGSSPLGNNAPEAQHAITHVKPIKPIGDLHWIECKLETGRTHQIRIHLAEAGHRLCGEKTYNRPMNVAPLADTANAPRQVLHSAELRMNHPITGQPMQFKSDWPKDIQRWLEQVARLTRP
jgi:23S rRNA pseudouridine1911/1915/1917 synthase